MIIKIIKQKIHNFLSWSQKYLETDMFYIARSGFWLGLEQIVFVGLEFLLAIAFANLLPQEIYGTYRYLISIISIFSIFTLPGIDTAIIQAVAQNYDGTFIKALKTKIYWGTIGSLTTLVLALYYYINHNNILAICFFIAAPFISLIYSLSLYSALLVGKKLFKKRAIYAILSQLISVVILIGVLFFNNNLFLIILLFFLGQLIPHSLFLYLTLKKVPLNKNQSPQTIPFGKHLTLMGIIDIVAINIDKVLIWHFLGASSVAIYYFAILVPKQINSILVRVFAPLTISRFAEKDIIKKELIKKMGKFSLLMILMALIYIFIAPFIYKIFFPQYLSSILFSRLFSLTIIFSPLMFISFYFKAKLKTKNLYIITFFERGLRIILFLTLLPFYGIWGAIITPLISLTLNAPLYFYLFKKNDVIEESLKNF